MKNQDLVTMYFGGMFGVQKVVCKLEDFGTKPYAQYDAAAFVKFIPKGKRKAAGFIIGYNPYILILEGDNHPAPADAFTPKNITESGLVTSMSRYSSFDQRYLTEFDAKVAEYIKDQKVIMDVRHTVKTSVINK